MALQSCWQPTQILDVCLFPLLCCNALHTSSSVATEWIGSLCSLQLTEGRVLFSKGCTDRALRQYKTSLLKPTWGCPSTVLLTSLLSLFPSSFPFGMLDSHLIFPVFCHFITKPLFLPALVQCPSATLVGRYFATWKMWWGRWQQWRFFLEITSVSQLSRDRDINERHKRRAWMWQTDTLLVAFVFLICLHFWNKAMHFSIFPISSFRNC